MYRAHWLTTTRADGDFATHAAPSPELTQRRRAVVDRPWVWVSQVHGSTVVVVDDNNVETVAGSEGDALVTALPGVALAVHTADCGPVVFDSAEGVVGIAHAGWRGLEAGILDHTIETMRGMGATQIDAWLGPCISAECYEFGVEDLDRLAQRFGDAGRARTTSEAPALDLGWAIMHNCQQHDVSVADSSICTACDPANRYFSHRARGETARMATVVWREA